MRKEALIIEPKDIIFDLISRIIVSIAIVAKNDLQAYSLQIVLFRRNPYNSPVKLIVIC